MPAPSTFYRYFNANKDSVKLMNDLNVSAEQTVLLNKQNAELTTEERETLALSVTKEQATIVKIWKATLPKKEIKATTKRKTKVEIASSENEQKKFSHLKDELTNVEIRFVKYALDYSKEEIDEFKTKLTNFQKSIDSKITELEKIRKEAEQQAAINEFQALQDALNEKTEQLKKLGVPVQLKDGKIIINK